MDKKEGMKLLLGQGMSEEEAVKFLDGRKVTAKGLQLPPDQALDLMNKMSEFGMLTGPVRFYVMVTEDNAQRLRDLITNNGQEQVVEGDFDPGKMEEDPIGQIANGFSGTAGFGAIDPSKVN